MTTPRDTLSQLTAQDDATVNLSLELQSLGVTEIPAEVGTYLLSLMNAAGVTYSEPAMKKQMLLDLNTRLDGFLATAVIEALPEDKVEEFAKMQGSTEPQKVQEWLASNLPDAQAVFTKAFEEFKNVYLRPEVT
jgi:hypothetical protein